MGPLFEKIQSNVRYPEPRTQSRLLSLLPESTVLYAALPNYGDTSHQLLTVFQEELKENAKLREWYEKGEMATEGPKIENAIEEFYELSLYLGDEIVVSAAPTGKTDPEFVMVAEARKPGLKEFLPKVLKDLAGKSSPGIRVLDAAELATAKAGLPERPVVLVRPDLIVLGESLATVRRFNDRIEKNVQGLASAEFGQRLGQAYEGGATIVAGLDLEKILQKDGPKDEKSRELLQRTGFSDMKYLVWEHKGTNRRQVSQFELSFTGSRRGIASWVAAPGAMGSLDFVSPKAVIAGSILLKDPAQVFDDIAELATASNPNAMEQLGQMEQRMGVSLRNDVLGRLSGEIAVELDTLPPQVPKWKLMLKTKDPSGMLAMLRTFFAASKMITGEVDVDGVTYHTLSIPSPGAPTAITYAMVDGYLIVASSHDALADAISLHRSGESLAKSGKLAESLPGDSTEVSGLLYEDPRAVSALSLRNMAPEMADSLLMSTGDIPPAVVALYGDEKALREASRSGGIDFAGAMIVAAVAVPNLIRARVAANESSAVAMVRTANTAQIAYSMTYPQKGYAHDLATLGPNPDGTNNLSSRHAGLIDSTLGNSTCTAGVWCSKSGYRFTITTSCKLQNCKEYVVTATPESSSTGTRNFCSTSDALVRFQFGAPMSAAVTAAECRKWPPLY